MSALREDDSDFIPLDAVPRWHPARPALWSVRQWPHRRRKGDKSVPAHHKFGRLVYYSKRELLEHWESCRDR